jgi:hypothetical protein
MNANRVFAAAAGLSAAILTTGCFPAVSLTGSAISGTGNPVTREFDFTDFDKVRAGSAFQVEIEQGDRYEVTVTVDENIEPYLDVAQSGDTVRIGLKPGTWLRNATLRATVLMPALAAVDLSGATRGSLGGFSSGDRCSFAASGASTLRGTIDCGDVTVNASGASTIELAGEAGDLEVEASGASRAVLGDFRAEDVRVNANGASRIEVYASGRLTGEASGASTVQSVGKPASTNVRTSGASSVR